jgi:site-specific recombinase XerD
MHELTPDEIEIIKHKERMLTYLPNYVQDFVRAKEQHGISNQSLNKYLYRIRYYFTWLIYSEDYPEIKTNVPLPQNPDETICYEEIEYDLVKLQHLNNMPLMTIQAFLAYFKSENIHPQRNIKEANAVAYRSEKSVSAMISTLKSFYHYLAVLSDKDGETYIERNIMNKIQIPRSQETAAYRAEEISTSILPSNSFMPFLEFLEDSEQGYLSHISGADKVKTTLFMRDKERDIAMIALLLATGIRVGELVKIKMSDINFMKQTIRITRKANKKDTVYVMDYAFKRLLNYIKLRNKYPNAASTPFLFVTYHKVSKPIRIRTVQMIVEKYTAAYFNTSVYPHKLRHSFSVAFIENSGEISMLRDLLGHTDIKTTSLYVNMASSKKVNALERLNSILNTL